jgi:hypothetical protein
LIMSPLPLFSQTLAWLNHAANAGQRDAQALLHLIARADKHDQDVAKFVDSYSSTIAALCRRLEALELVAGLRHPVKDAETTESDSVSDIAQRIVWRWGGGQDWAKAFNAAPPAPEDLAADQAMAANLSALLVKECGLYSPGSSTHDLLQRAAAMLVNHGLPARSATPPDPTPKDAARPTFLDAIRLAEGCHDYSGGHSGAEGKAWHGAIDTVVDVLKRAAEGPWDSQTKAVFGVGAEPQAGEVKA